MILRAGVLSLAISLGGAAVPAMAQPQPDVPIRAFDLSTTEKLGQAIYRQDQAAWHATDAVMAAAPKFGEEGGVGWIVEDDGDHQLVRFLKRVNGELAPGYDVDFDDAGKATVRHGQLAPLKPSEIAMFSARQSAMQAVKRYCTSGYNTVVLPDPEQPGWLVWLLAPMTDDAIYIGGHYRVSVSEDGKTVHRVDALSRTCVKIDPPGKLGSGKGPVMGLVTHLVSPIPVETHVFLQLEMRQPLAVGTSDRKVWKIEDGKISVLNDPAK